MQSGGTGHAPHTLSNCQASCDAQSLAVARSIGKKQLAVVSNFTIWLMSVGLSKSDSLSLRKQVLLACDYCSTLSAERAQHGGGKSIEMLGILGRPLNRVLFVDFIMGAFTCFGLLPQLRGKGKL